MSESRQQPYFNYALKHLPKDDRLAHCVAEYLYMRLSKNKQLSVSDWESCIDELVNAFDVQSQGKVPKTTVRRLETRKPKISVSDLCYLFMTATKRKWNHVYFTKEQDMMYDNISFYQDPYWQKLIHDPKTRQRLEEQLKECKNSWID